MKSKVPYEKRLEYLELEYQRLLPQLTNRKKAYICEICDRESENKEHCCNFTMTKKAELMAQMKEHMTSYIKKIRR